MSSWYENLSPDAQQRFTGRRMFNLVCYMFEMLEKTRLPSLELWTFYWAQSDFVKLVVAAHYVMTKVAQGVEVPKEAMEDAVYHVPFPFMRQFFRRNGENVLLDRDRLRYAIAGTAMRIKVNRNKRS